MKTKAQIPRQIAKPCPVIKADCCCLLNYPPIRLCVFFIDRTVVRILLGEKNTKFPVENVQKKPPPPLLKHELNQYFAGLPVSFIYPTRFLEGTCFQRDIWEALATIPSGETRSYRWLARQAGRPKAVRAVGNALGENPIPLIVPCHRIILSSGGMGGYSPGIYIKRFLLELERGERGGL